MGTYTELIFGVALKENTPTSVIDTLHYMVNPNVGEPLHVDFPHQHLLRGCSEYFPVEAESRMWQHPIRKRWHISTRSNIKNYNKEIEQFLEWIKPYVESGSGFNDIYAMTICEDDAIPTIYSLFE